MDGLFLACLMGICGMPMSPSAEPLAPVALVAPAGTTAPRAASPPVTSSTVAELAAAVSIAPPASTPAQPVERPVPVPSEEERPAPAAPDAVSTALAAASGGKTSRAAIEEVVRRHAAAVRRCYEAGLADDPAYAGTLEVAWRIQVDGRVQSVSVVGGTARNTTAERCLMAEIPRWTFTPTAEPTVVGSYPFAFDATLLARHPGPASTAASGTPLPARPPR